MVLAVILPIFTELIKDPINRIIVSAKRHICYAFTCDRNVQKLAQETEELKNKTLRLQQSVDEATRKGNEIHEHVTKWLTSADRAIQEAQEVIAGKDEAMQRRCFIGFCPSLKRRYQLSRRAEKKASAIQNENEPAEPISYSPAPKQMTAPSVYSREALPSRVSMLKDVMDALKDPELNMIGVYGMGGVGKTTLAKEVHRLAQDEKLFDIVVLVAVSQSPEIARIQKEIAEVLGLDLNEEGLLLRAYKLSKRLKKEKKILIILDDVWKQLKLEEVGIPFGDDCKGCKILLTSRSKDVLSREMSTQRELKLDVLQKEEGWSLFQMIAADAKDPNLLSIATEIANKCGGLPLLLLKVATDLQKKESYAWSDKLKQLSAFDNEETQRKIHSILESSYENLADNEVKSFFLLCGLLGHSNIQIQSLIRYSMGLGIFRQVTSMEEARNRVRTVIDKLKDQCLLLDGDMDGFVKMHDIVRDTALTIASKEQHAFVGLSGRGERVKPNKDCTRISLPYCDLEMLPEVLECPKAEILLLFTEDFSLKICGSYFEGMRKLKVVDFTGMHFAALPSSLGFLANIHTLCLHRCQLDDGIAIIGELKQLEVLSFANSYIVELPREIEQLGRLKLLDLSNCSKLKVIPANVLSKLTKLEELYMRKSFVQWEGINNKQKNASLGELEELRVLTTLELEVPNSVVLQKFMLSKVLRKYWIYIGERIMHFGNESNKFSKALLFKVSNGSIIDLGHGMIVLLKEIEYLYLSGMGNGLYGMDDGEGFPHLKHLVVENDDVIQQIIKCAGALPNLEFLSLGSLKSLRTICDGEVAAGSFRRLTTLKVSQCDSLTNLLSIEAARCLSQLQVLEVEDCGEMEYIVVGEDNNEMVEFTHLVSLKLRRLPNIRSFWKGKKQSTADPAMSKDASLSLFNTTTKVSFPKLEHLSLSEINCTMIWELDHHHHQLSNLTTLTVDRCKNLKHLFGVSLIKSLSHLKSLEVRGCQSMEEIILTEETESVEEEEIEEEEERKLIVFPKLDSLGLQYLSKLKRFCSGYSIESQSLKELRISSCNDLISFAVPYNNGGGGADTEVDTENFLFNHMVAFPNLEVLDVNDMSGLKYIWHSQLGDDDFFSKLESLTISNCSKLLSIFPLNGLTRFQRLEKLDLKNLLSLKHIWSKNLQEAFAFEKLQSLHVSWCEDLKYIFPSSIARNLPRLEKLEIDECGVLEIIAEAECAEQSIHPFEFPQLLSVRFSNLKKLTSFYRKMHVELPNLKCADVYGCHKVILSMFVVDKVKERLEEVRLEGKDLMMMERGEGFPFDKFSKLKVATLMSFNRKCLHFLKRLHRLETLVVRKGSVQVLFSEELGVGEVHVKHLELYSLPNLKHIWKWNQHSPLNLHSLQTLQVEFCHRLINIAPSSSSFKNLSSLYVSNCRGLKNLVTASTAKTMVNLTQMTVQHCKNMIEIVTKDDAVEEEIIIDFKKLKSLKLEGLPNLTCFSSSINYIFNFLSLEQVLVEGCFRMITFYDGPLTTPKLRGLQNYIYGQQWEGSFKATIPSLLTKWVVECRFSSIAIATDELSSFKNLTRIEVKGCESVEQVFDLEGLSAGDGLLQELRELHLINLPMLTHFCKKNPQGILDLKNLVLVKLENCGSLKYAITQSMALCLSNLKTLEVKSCKMMKELIETAAGSDNNIIFPSLTKISIYDCPKLKMQSFFSMFDEGEDQNQVKNSLEKVAFGWKDLMMMERGGFPVEKLSKLKVVELISLRHKCLHFLEGSIEMLVVQHGSIQVLFSQERIGEKQQVHVKHLKLQFLHNLKHIWKWNQHSPLNLYSLRTLQVRWCGSLINIVPSSSSFQNLSSLHVSSCCGLKNLISASTATTMVNLTEMTVYGCKNMTEIVAKDDAAGEEIIIEFKKLKSLTLQWLSNLTCFSSAINQVFNFPSLEQVMVDRCYRMITFYDGPLTTPKLRGIETNYGQQQWKGSFNATIRNLLTKWVVECRFSSIAIATDELSSFKNLTRIEVKGCESVEQVFDLEGLSTGDGLLQELRELHLINLPMLTHLCNKNPQGILDLKNLVLVKLENCGSLKYAFTQSMALCLSKLKTLEVKSCKMMEGLIEAAVGSDNNIVFSELKSVALENLSNFLSFYSGCGKVECPSLTKISINDCPKLKMQPFFSMFDEEQDQHQGFPSLEELSLDNKSIIILQSKLATAVRVLDLRSFPNKSHFSSIPRSINLEEVKVHDSSCSSLKELFEGLDYDESKLESLEVYECHRLVSLAPSFGSFQTLTILNVHNCNGLTNLVTSTAAKSMVHLEELKVQDCNNLIEIVAGEEDGTTDEIVFTNLEKLILYDLQSLTAFCLGNYTFAFPCLEEVRLGIFPNFRTFCHGALTAPKLHSVELTGIDQMIRRTEGHYWKSDLNATIKQLHVKMVGFKCLKDLKLSKFLELKEKWHDQFPFSCLRSLTELVVDECGLFSSAIPSNVLQAVDRLEVLVVEKCESLEKVFDLDSLNADEGDIGLMGQLNELHLIDLPRLRNLWNKDHGGILSFENLTLLKVHDCGKLTNIFTMSMALDLVNLQQLEVKRCTSVEHIITKDAKEEETALMWDKTIFPNLNSMRLECLPSLSSFYSEGEVLECPSLTKIDVVLCPKIQLFPSTFSNEDIMIFAGKVVIPSSEELKVEWNIVKDMLNENFRVFLHGLKVIEVTCFPGESAHLPSQFIQSLPNLEKLILSDAFSEETILHELKLPVDEDSLPVLEFQNLETLQVLECCRMKVLLSSSMSFQTVTKLEVSKCHGLINLMTASVARSLVQLRRMNIQQCEMLQEIVASEADEGEDKVVFIRLKCLTLQDLPRLKSFCSGCYAFNFPSLEEVIIRECPSMKIFAHEVLATQKLWRIQTGEFEYEWEWEGDLKKTIQALATPANDEADVLHEEPLLQ